VSSRQPARQPGAAGDFRQARGRGVAVRETRALVDQRRRPPLPPAALRRRRVSLRVRAGAVDATYEVRQVDVGFRLRVRVTAISDAGGLESESALTAVVPAPPGNRQGSDATTPTLMRPFPRVRIRGYYTSHRAVLDLVVVTAPRGARLAVSCRRSAACPFRHRARLLTSRRIRVRALERAFPAGTRIEFRITKPSRIGKYTRVVIGAGRAPARRDRCLMPDRRRPVACEPTSPGQR
jgi:hypothetical protein